MISMLIYDSRQSEIKLLRDITRNEAAYQTDEQWEISCFSSLDESNEFWEKHPLINLCCYDVTTQGSVDALVKFRRTYSAAGLLIIADAATSPLMYLKPGIRPDSLLMRPLKRENTQEAFHDFLSAHLCDEQDNEGVKSFLVESKSGKTHIPFRDIYYFEAREKKVFVRTYNEEYGFYDTLEKLESRMPEGFARCHRSFVVNTGKIRKIMLSKNCIELADGFEVPLSRNYKQEFKKFGK